MKTIALIPMRSGSKGIRNKNIKIMCGKPLFYWAAKAAYGSSLIDSVYFSTDSEEYVQNIRAYFPKANILMRNKMLSNDSASLEAVMMDFIKHVDFDVLATIQVTNPLIRAIDLTKAVMYMKEHNYNSIVSTVELKRFAWPHWEPWRKTGAYPINYDHFHRPNRQDGIEPIHIENGSFYLTERRMFDSKTISRLAGKIGIYSMPEDSIYEIDDDEDWGIVERMLSRRLHNV